MDWEARVLPSEARCRVWAEKGGVWHLTTNSIDGAFCMARGVRSGYPSDADKPLWRPWLKGEPACWNATFYPMTHPPIPEGWEKVGEWLRDVDMVNDGRPGLVYVGTGDGGGTFLSGDGFRVVVRRVPPPADWKDVPKGVKLRPNFGRGGASNDVILGGAYVGRVFDESEEGYYAHGTDQMPAAGSPFATLPAAIVALTGRRE